jgi:tripartite-type tricarboxylate transporter receptor subunit TctC
VTQVLGGHIDAGVTTISGTLPLYQSGQVRLLGTFTAERWPDLPEVPTFKEQGVDVEWGAVRGIAAPAGLPPELLETLSGAVKAAAEDPDFIAAAEKAGIALSYLDGEAFRALAERQLATLQKVWDESPWQ